MKSPTPLETTAQNELLSSTATPEVLNTNKYFPSFFELLCGKEKPSPDDFLVDKNGQLLPKKFNSR